MISAESCAKVTLVDLLQFITGADRLPPLGFDKPISVAFYEMMSQCHFPCVSTCDLSIQLSRGFQCPEEFQCLMEEAVLVIISCSAEHVRWNSDWWLGKSAR